jgi:hypothetical protein
VGYANIFWFFGSVTDKITPQHSPPMPGFSNALLNWFWSENGINPDGIVIWFLQVWAVPSLIMQKADCLGSELRHFPCGVFG